MNPPPEIKFPTNNDILRTVDFYDQCNEIFQRHYNKHPDKTIQEKIISFAESYRNRKQAPITANG